MIVALFVLALAMLVGGIASIVQGAPFIRLEMGWTMVIAGSVVMSGGAILAGVAAAVWRLRRIELELVEARETAGRLPGMPALPLPNFVPPGAALPPAAPEAAPRLPGAERQEPVLPPAPPSPPAQNPERLAPDERAVLAAGDLMPPLSARRDEAPPEHEDTVPVATPEPNPIPAEAPAPHAADDKGTEVVPPPAAQEPATAHEPVSAHEPVPEPLPRVVAGTYASGGNTYVMYSDGSIEAETPGGKYTFNSLEELKAFAASEGATVPPPGRP
jgi:hypothetical protein